MSINEQVLDPSVPIEEIGAAMDELDHAARVAVTRSMSRKVQRALWRKAAQAAPLSVDDFVPPSRGERTEVIHHGTNTLPLPPMFKRFQKRFCRPSGSPGVAFGYNESPTRALLGPGYFVLIPTAEQPHWWRRGEVVVDYFQVPQAAVVEGWPRVVPNSQGLQILVYHHTRDLLRKVSHHVTIGAAHKGEQPLDQYFTLVRED